MRIRSSPSSRDSRRCSRASACFVAFSVSGALPAISVASSSTRRCKAETSSTTSLSSPTLAASSAPMSRAVNIRSFTRAGPFAGALEHEHLDRAVLIGLLAYLREPLVHLEREGIARLRTVERGAPDAVPHLEKEVIGAHGLLVHAISVPRQLLLWRSI